MKYLVFILTLLLAQHANKKRFGLVEASEGRGEDKDDPSITHDDAQEQAAPQQQQQQQQQGPKITPTSWVLSATTHMPKQLPHALAKDLSKQANYIHWTCYRQEPTAATDKLQCCREIYQLQERDPFHLCWKKKSCLRDKVGRSEFMHYCTEQIVPLDTLAQESDQSIQPRFSLLVAPQLADLPSDQWRQFVSFDSSQGGHWMYMIESPFRLAMDPQSFFASRPKDENEQSEESTKATTTTEGVLQAKISSNVLPDPGDDEDFRDFQQKLVVEPLPAGTDDDDALWTVSLEILLYLPEAAGLRKKPQPPKCQTSAGQCQLQLKTHGDAVDQQSLVQTSLVLSNVPSSSGTTVEWTYSIALDDDNIILPGPFIFAGSAARGDNKVKWKASAMDKFAFSTALNEHDEL